MATGVLLSGGLDSVVLLADEATQGEVRPIYVKVGLAWESAERVAVEQCLRHVLPGYSTPLATLSVDMTDVYPASHWAMAGRPPEYHTPDEDVYLHGRNIGGPPPIPLPEYQVNVRDGSVVVTKGA